jgi:hypothetical protein
MHMRRRPGYWRHILLIRLGMKAVCFHWPTIRRIRAET